MEWFIGRKSVQLLAGLLTFFVTVLAVARSTPMNSPLTSTINTKIIAWQQAVKSQPPLKKDFRRDLKSSKSSGGPGWDGGGGTGVLLSTGRLRFLDMAAYEKRDLVPFDNETYARMLLKNGRYVPAAGELVKSSEFFSCSDKILSAQSNPLLQYLVSKNLKIEIIKTSVPLDLPQGDGAGTEYQSTSGWINEVTSLPPEILKSSTYPAEFQRPIASYAAQPVGRAAGGLFEQTLVISSQLYDLLSERDKCALQVHEIFRYVGNFGNIGTGSGSPLRLLTRALTTLEIETLTQKVMNGDSVLVSEIPAMESYKLFSVASLTELDQLSSTEYDSLIQRLVQMGVLSGDETEETETSLGSTFILYRMWENTNLGTSLAEEGIMELQPKRVKSKQRRLQKKQIDLRSLLDSKRF